MAPSPLALDADCLDLVITNATIIDAVQGIVKADIGIQHGRIAGIPSGHEEESPPNRFASTVRAACHPAIPCTPAPGGVDAEQRKRSGAGVV